MMSWLFKSTLLPTLALMTWPCAADEATQLKTAFKLLSETTPSTACPGEPTVALPAIDCSFITPVGAQPTAKSGEPSAVSLGAARAATLPVKGSPYAKYHDIGFLVKGSFITDCFSVSGYRYSDGDRCSVEHLLSGRAVFGPGVAVMMSSGGSHSIAMAAELVRDGSYQAVWKMGSEIAPHAVAASEQDVSAFRYHYPDFIAAHPLPGAPPVLIMDQHRGDQIFENDFDNRAEFTTAQYPSAREYQDSGIKKIIWIVEGAKTDAAPVALDDASLNILANTKAGPGHWEQYSDDPIVTLRKYIRAGISVYIQHISPYDCPYSKRHKAS